MCQVRLSLIFKNTVAKQSCTQTTGKNIRQWKSENKDCHYLLQRQDVLNAFQICCIACCLLLQILTCRVTLI